MPAAFDGESHPEHIQAAIDSRLREIDPVVSAFRLRNRYRDGVGTWIVSVASPSGHTYDLSRLESAAAVLGMLIEGTFEYDGDLGQAIRDDLGEPPIDAEGLPTTSEDQSCAFCGRVPHWVHPLDQSLSTFRHDGERYQLPTFWTICSACEALYVAENDTELAHINQRYEREPLAMAEAGVRTFRAAETGRKELAPSRYPD